MKNTRAKVLTESAIMIAFSTVLSLFTLAKLPYGGSVTVASALPVVIIAYRYGTSWGLLTGVVYAVIQNLVGMSNVLLFSDALSIVAVIVLDYIIAFTAAGFAGVFRKCVKNQALALALGSALICVIRYLCHFVSGFTVWAGFSIPTKGALVYSLIYNATYMIPETIVLVIAALYVGSVIDFRTAYPTRISRESVPANISFAYPVAGLLACAAVIFDVSKIFEKLQDARTGKFTVTAISEVDWLAVIIVTAVVTAVDIAILAIRRSIVNKEEK